MSRQKDDSYIFVLLFSTYGLDSRQATFYLYLPVVQMSASGFSNKLIASATGIQESDIEGILKMTLSFRGWAETLTYDPLSIYKSAKNMQDFRTLIGNNELLKRIVMEYTRLEKEIDQNVK